MHILLRYCFILSIRRQKINDIRKLIPYKLIKIEDNQFNSKHMYLFTLP